MAEDKRSNGVQPIYSALIGGMMASFMAVLVFTTLVDMNYAGGGWKQLAAVIVGLVSAAAFMTAGMTLTKRLPWLSGGLLFAAGFTTLWSAILSLSVEQKWVATLALGIATAMGVALGWWRFGRSDSGQDGGSSE